VDEASAEEWFSFPVEELDQTKSAEVFAISGQVANGRDAPSKERDDEPVKLGRSTLTQPSQKPDAGKQLDQTPSLTETDADQAELEMARDRVKWAEEMHKKGFVSDAQLAAERLKLQSVKIERALEKLKRTEETSRKGGLSRDDVQRQRDAVRSLEAVRARADLDRAADRLEWAKKMFVKGYVSKSQMVAEELSYRRARDALELAQSALAVTKELLTLQGVVRDRETGEPISRIQVSDLSSSRVATVDGDGRFILSRLQQKKYTLVALALGGQPYMTSSKVVERSEGKVPGLLELELTRGIPFRVRVLDAATNKPIPGSLDYFPVDPNDPFERGIMGYAAGGPSAGAFYEALPDGHTGEYYGALLSGPGILCFTRADGKGRGKRGDTEPQMLYPDGKNAVTLLRDPANKISLSAPVPVSMDSKRRSAFIGLWQYDAVIVVSPRAGTKELEHVIRLEQGGG
jgi:hypothetical protein